MQIPESMNDDGQTYKINTQCEMLFGMLKATYPDGTSLPRLEMKALIEKYPEEFNQVLIPIMMKESSINPDLKSTAMLLMDPERSAKLKQIFDINNCQEFFDSHGSTSIP